MLQLLRNKVFLTALAVVLALLLLLGATRQERPGVTLVERVLADLLSPLQRFSTGVVEGLQDAGRFVADLRHLREENQVLKHQLTATEQLQARVGELEAENESLRRELKLAQATPYSYVSAAVIGRSPNNWFSTITIDKGLSSGIARDMPVVTDQGLVGRISKVTNFTATVTLILDRDSGVGAVVRHGTSGDLGVVSGQGNERLKLKFFSRDAEVGFDDLVVTSGLGGVYPKGIIIGRVRGISREDYGLLKVATGEPSVEFNRLERVMVVVSAGER